MKIQGVVLEFECKDCGNKIINKVPFFDDLKVFTKILNNYPCRCSCGNNRNFRLLSIGMEEIK